MSRLIVLSNRVKMPDNDPMAGGLAIALPDVLKVSSSIWMGWNGEVVDAHCDLDCDKTCDHSYSCKCQTNEFGSRKQTNLFNPCSKKSTTHTTYITTALTTKQYQHYYCGFANNVLWPLLHERTDLIGQAPQDYAIYQNVNQLFASQLKKIVQPNDIIWVHDYHFLSVAYYCRKLGIRNRIGFFLHIPFTPLTFWQQLNKSGELIHHLAHYDVFGTQTQQDKANCLNVLKHYIKDKFSQDSLFAQRYTTYLKTKEDITKSNQKSAVQLRLNLELCPSHCLAVAAYPIGINVARIQQQVSGLSLSVNYKQVKDDLTPATKKIIAVDRIDYSKGLLERFSAYQHFLHQYPMYQNQLQFLQIACPSRLDLPIYKQLYDNVKQAVNDINQYFRPNDSRSRSINFNDNKSNWQPITYSEEVLGHETLMRTFWHSDIGWVNSLKDGMNLVAKEYIAAQNPADPGVLLLSRYAGASEQMQAAVIIDPRQPKSIIQGLHNALNMPLEERKSRHQTLLQGLQQNNLQAWQQDFLRDLYTDKKCQQPVSAAIDRAV